MSVYALIPYLIAAEVLPYLVIGLVVVGAALWLLKR